MKILSSRGTGKPVDPAASHLIKPLGELAFSSSSDDGLGSESEEAYQLIQRLLRDLASYL